MSKLGQENPPTAPPLQLLPAATPALPLAQAISGQLLLGTVVGTAD